MSNEAKHRELSEGERKAYEADAAAYDQALDDGSRRNREQVTRANSEGLEKKGGSE